MKFFPIFFRELPRMLTTKSTKYELKYFHEILVIFTREISQNMPTFQLYHQHKRRYPGSVRHPVIKILFLEMSLLSCFVGFEVVSTVIKKILLHSPKERR
jgi:hypothetical protein